MICKFFQQFKRICFQRKSPRIVNTSDKFFIFLHQLMRSNFPFFNKCWIIVISGKCFYSWQRLDNLHLVSNLGYVNIFVTIVIIKSYDKRQFSSFSTLHKGISKVSLVESDNETMYLNGCLFSLSNKEVV